MMKFRVRSFFNLSSEKIYKWWLMIEFIHKRSKDYDRYVKHKNGVYEFLDQILAVHEKKFQQNSNENVGENPKTFLSQLYNIRDTMSYDEMRESTFAFLAAGFDTTGKIIPATLLLLAMNPKIQEKLFNELSGILTSDEDEVDEINLSEMIYLEQVIKESARLIPPVLIFARETTKNIDLGKNRKSTYKNIC